MTELTPSWFSRNIRWFGPTVLVVGIAAIGLLSGFYIGVSGFNATIVAATLTAITAGAAATVGFIRLGKPDFQTLAIIGILLIVYSGSTLVGAKIGSDAKDDYEIAQLFGGIELRAKYLLRCAEMEAIYDINGYRTKLGLVPIEDLSLCK